MHHIVSTRAPAAPPRGCQRHLGRRQLRPPNAITTAALVRGERAVDSVRGLGLRPGSCARTAPWSSPTGHRDAHEPDQRPLVPRPWHRRRRPADVHPDDAARDHHPLRSQRARARPVRIADLHKTSQPRRHRPDQRSMSPPCSSTRTPSSGWSTWCCRSPGSLPAPCGSVSAPLPSTSCLVVAAACSGTLGPRVFRGVPGAYAMWPLALVRGLARTDAATWWFRSIAIGCAAVVTAAVGWRVSTVRRRGHDRVPASSPPPPREITR